MNCKECGSELVMSDDKELQTFVKEYAKLFTGIGLLKGAYRTFNYFRGKYSKTIWEVKGFYYCPRCKTYILKCPNCGHNLQLGREYPVQGNKYKCTSCGDSMIFYYDGDDSDYIDYTADIGYM